MYIFFDTETNGLLNFKRDLMDESQPRIIQLAAILTDRDLVEVDSMSAYIKPDGWIIPEETTKIHGITIEKCESDGIPMPEALARFNELKARATHRFAFNIAYDKRMLAREANLYGIPHDSSEIETFCVMTLAKPECKIPPTAKMMSAGFKTYKTPNLSEAHEILLGHAFDGAHDALNDVRATIQVFSELRKRLPEPMVVAF